MTRLYLASLQPPPRRGGNIERRAYLDRDILIVDGLQ
jgi:hypothetical protein